MRFTVSSIVSCPGSRFCFVAAVSAASTVSGNGGRWAGRRRARKPAVGRRRTHEDAVRKQAEQLDRPAASADSLQLDERRVMQARSPQRRAADRREDGQSAR